MEEGTVRTRAELVDLGWSLSEVRRGHRSGQLQRLRRGVYLATGSTTSWERHAAMVAATVPTLEADTVVCDVSAAWCWGMPLWRLAPPVRVSVIRSRAGHGQVTRTLHSFSCPLARDEVCELNGVQVTTLARTAVDIARHWNPDVGVVALDWARRQGVSRDELEDLVARGRRRPGNARARRLVEFASPLAESPAESVSRLRMHQHGIPAPMEQVEVFDARGLLVARSDFAWPRVRLIGECDGQAKYETLRKPGEDASDVVLAEKRRERGLRDLGWDVIRWDPRDLQQGAQFGAMLRRALSRAERLSQAS